MCGLLSSLQSFPKTEIKKILDLKRLLHAVFQTLFIFSYQKKRPPLKASQLVLQYRVTIKIILYIKLIKNYRTYSVIKSCMKFTASTKNPRNRATLRIKITGWIRFFPFPPKWTAASPFPSSAGTCACPCRISLPIWAPTRDRRTLPGFRPPYWSPPSIPSSSRSSFASPPPVKRLYVIMNIIIYRKVYV